MSEATWDELNLPDLTGYIVVITGSSDGIGFQNARAVALRGAQVVMAVRNVEKGEKKADEIRAMDAEAKIEVLEVDVSSLDSVRRFCRNFPHPHINVLINNAGIANAGDKTKAVKSEQGYEMVLATNHLGPFLLTGMLLPLLTKIPGSRVVMVGSKMHENANVDLSDLNWEKRKYDAMQAYADSKRLTLYMMTELNRRLKDQGLQDPSVVASHPGASLTNMMGSIGGLMSFFGKMLAQPVEMGALPTLRAAFGDGVQPNDYFGPKDMFNMRGYPVLNDAKEGVSNRAEAKRSWTVCEALTAFKYRYTTPEETES